MEYELYGDESIKGNQVVYGIIFLPSAHVEEAEKSLAEVKLRYGGRPEDRFHCRQIFHDNARNNSKWAHLSREKAFQFAQDFWCAVENKSLRTFVGHVNKSTFPLEIFGAGDIKSVQFVDDKQLIPYAYQVATATIVGDPLYRGNCRLWTDLQKDKISWPGKNRQVGRLLKSNYVDLEKRTVETVMIPENMESREHSIILEVADLLAYSAASVLSKRADEKSMSRDVFLQHMLRAMKPEINEFRMVQQDSSTTGMLSGFDLSKLKVT